MAKDLTRVGVAAVIAAYRPLVAEPAAVFARSVVATLEPPSVARAKALLWACARLGAFGLAVGLEPEPAVLLHPSVIERFVLVGVPEVSQATRRTLRTNLRWVAAGIDGHPRSTPLSRQRATAPYTSAQIAAYLALADTQPSVARRMRVQALVCLGAGAGLTGADLRQTRGTDIVARSGGVVVVVNGRRPRVVPVLARYQKRLVASATWAGEGWVIGGVDPVRRNVTTALISSLAGGIDLPRLRSARLRSTWLVEVADRLGIASFLAAAGVVCTQRLGDLVAGLDAAGETEAVALLGARS